MNKSRAVHRVAVLVGALTVFAVSAEAHHGPSTEPLYDTSEVMEFEGEVTAVFWRNPHARFRFRVTAGPQTGEIWEVETNPPGPLSRVGFPSDLLPIGSEIKVAGIVSRRKANYMSLYNLLLPNGYEFSDMARPNPLRFSDQKLPFDFSSMGGAEDASIEEFYRAWKRGSNFVTNGPILQLSTASNRRPGDTIKLSPSGGTIDVRLEVVSDQPLQTVQLVVNGEVIESFDIKDPKRVEVTRKVTMESGSWIVARCTARDDWLTDKELTPYDGRGTRDPFGVARSRLRFAHSSPIYVTVGGRGPLVRRSVEEGLVMLDRFDDFATATAAPAFQSSIQAAVAAARDKLKRRLRASE